MSLSSDRQHSVPVPVLRPSAQCPCPQTVSTVSLSSDRQHNAPVPVLRPAVSRPHKVHNSVAKLVSKPQPCATSSSSPSLVTGPSRTDYKLSCIYHNVFPDPSAYLSHLLTLCTPLPGSFVLLQKHAHPLLLKQKSLANVLSGTVHQSNCTLSLLTSVRFNPTMPSELFHSPLPIPVTFILCTLVCTLASVVCEEYSILSTYVFLYVSCTYFC